MNENTQLEPKVSETLYILLLILHLLLKKRCFVCKQDMHK